MAGLDFCGCPWEFQQAEPIRLRPDFPYLEPGQLKTEHHQSLLLPVNMVVLAAAICTKSGKAVVSRQFRDMARSRVEALIASFPKLADTSTQHTVVEQDSVRFIYQPLDELYMLLITNKQSNILQDIDTLHIFAQVVTSTCKSLDEREIIRNAYELLSAFDELVTLGYRENLTVSQIKAFLEMESHEERIQEIISRVSCLRLCRVPMLTCLRTKNWKQLKSASARPSSLKCSGRRRREAALVEHHHVHQSILHTLPRSEQQPMIPMIHMKLKRTNLLSQTTLLIIPGIILLTYTRATAPKGKGMQLGKKSKTTDMFERVRGEMGAEVEEAPLVSSQTSPIAAETPSAHGMSLSNHEGIQVTIAETMNANISREGALNSVEVKGDLHLRVTDQSLTKIKLDLVANSSHGVQFKTHPNVDKAVFNSSKAIQMSKIERGFPINNSVAVLRWRAIPKTAPISFTVWISPPEGSNDRYTISIAYELTEGEELRDVAVTIPYSTSEPAVSSFDATYEVSGDSLEWSIGSVDDNDNSGSFEFEAQAEDENEFFPMQVRFSKTKPFVDVDVSSNPQRSIVHCLRV